MIGQQNLIKKFNSFSLDNLPKSIILFGDLGSGRHTLTKNLCNRLGLSLVEINKDIEVETLIEYQQTPINKMYLIVLDDMLEKDQNKFLKFIEEPAKNVYITVLAKSSNTVLETIKNRCINFYIEDYLEEELKQIKSYDYPEIYKVCKTPGQLLNVDSKNFLKLLTLCDAIVTKLVNARFSNTLSISTKINYKDEYDKFDFYLFLNTLEWCAFEDFSKNNRESSFEFYKIVNKYRQQLLQMNTPIKENYIINLLTNLWEASRNGIKRT